EDGVRRLRRRLEKAEAAFLAVESLVPLAGACDDEANALLAVVDRHHRREGGARGHWRLPRRSPHASRMASARSKPSAMQVKARASRSAAIQANCLSVARPPSAFSSSAKQRPLWTANTSGTPGLTPRPFMIAASTGLR